MSRKKTDNGGGDVGLDIVEQFDTYEDYLDSQLTSTDMFYLEEEDVYLNIKYKKSIKYYFNIHIKRLLDI